MEMFKVSLNEIDKKLKLKGNYYFCYNKQQADYIKSKGIPSITFAQEMITKTTFTLFEGSEQLNVIIKEYNDGRKSRRLKGK